jgi:hypothetical protein
MNARRNMAFTKQASTWMIPMNMDGWVKSPPKKRSKQTLHGVHCKHCGLAGHSRTASRQCLKHKDQPEAAAAEAVQVEAQDPNDSEEDAARDIDDYAGEILQDTLEEHLQRHAAEDAEDSRNNNSNDDDKHSEVQELHHVLF